MIEIDLVGAEKFFSKELQANAIFILPPNLEELEKRLKGRGTDSSENIQKRIKIAQKEIDDSKTKTFIQKTFVNSEFEDFYREAVAYLRGIYDLPY